MSESKKPISDPSTRQEMIGILVNAGMSIEEADNFFQQGNIITETIVQVPGAKAARAIPALARMGLISGAVTIKIKIERSRQDAFVALAEKVCDLKVVLTSDFTGEFEKRTENFTALSGLDKLVN